MIASMDPRAGRLVYAFDEAPSIDPPALTRLLGGKGANLVVMSRDLGLPVPPGFTITTDACAATASGQWPDGLEDELRAALDALGGRLGRRFGDPDDPLLVSVRSGAPVSMPGMMETVLNVGLTSRTVAGLASVTGDAAFAADCLERLRTGYRDVIGAELPDDPWEQLRTAVRAVFASWNGDKARAYRQREGISDNLGTAVTVQAMVFGNRGPDSATGVCFTRDPSTGRRELFGDVLFEAQGEDVVAGGERTEPLDALAARLPDVAAELRRHADRLERHFADLCDIEFTVEAGSLWLLQVRSGKRTPRAALRIAIDMAEDPSFPLSREDAVRRVAQLLVDPPREVVLTGPRPTPIAAGLPASPGLASGAIVTSSEAAEAAAADGTPAILVRRETSPSDVRGMAVAAGILTARGGFASHAAVVARGWGIPAVVGAADVEPDADGVTIGGVRLAAGTPITIDGSIGEVFAGALASAERTLPEVETLVRWAEELGIPLDAPTALEGAAAEPAATLPPPTDADVLRALLVRGQCAEPALCEGLLAAPDDLDPTLARLVDAGAVERGDDLRLTPAGRVAAQAAFAADRDRLGEDRCVSALESFHALDRRMKAIVTDWQVREDEGGQRLNDHSDPAYDAGVLDRLAALHVEAAAWLDGWDLRPMRAYRARLARAVQLARGGDHRYVASPRVDSYHSAWFELHEELIRLSGRSRAEVSDG